MLEDNGERVIPEKMKDDNGMWLEHLARYYFALPFAKGRVLDIACGSGYGTKLVAKARKKEGVTAIGADIDEDALQYARGKYYHPQVAYQYGDLLDPALPETLGTFDTVLSFETIEHVPDDQFALEQLMKLTAPGGTLLLSTPFGAGREAASHSPFHYFQMTEEEFLHLFDATHDTWDSLRFFYQNGVSIVNEKIPGFRYPIGIAAATKKT
ncbi:class I SAM-dependent methyltransferase [Alkalicoccus chagannorensis]|uniref:class I SAM-dependent methyltransferase n=1 Tax=Alkalicoccus chagannorensis TaxID=427072 RepID=UPI000418C7F4|nr:class I SAM-dependent methyltransferase [Alkalicoccus chagannorensis]